MAPDRRASPGHPAANIGQTGSGGVGVGGDTLSGERREVTGERKARRARQHSQKTPQIIPTGSQVSFT